MMYGELGGVRASHYPLQSPASLRGALKLRSLRIIHPVGVAWRCFGYNSTFSLRTQLAGTSSAVRKVRMEMGGDTVARINIKQRPNSSHAHS